MEEAVAEVVPPGEMTKYKSTHDKVEAWMYTGSGKIQAKHLRTHTESAVVDTADVKPYLANLGAVAKKFKSEAAKQQFVDDLANVIYASRKIDHFYEIKVPPEVGGERVLETFLFMTRKNKS